MTWRPLTEAEKADYDRMLRARYMPPPATEPARTLPAWPHALALAVLAALVLAGNIAVLPA